MTVGTLGFVRERLTEARQSLGLTKVALAELVGVTPQAITQYESGPQTPRPDVMERLCDKLGFSQSFFLRPALPDEEEPIFWRSNASATQIARERSLQRLRWLKEIILYVRGYFDLPALALPVHAVVGDFRELALRRVEEIAQECRDFWGFGTGPIPDLLLELENSGVVTARINVAAETLDAFSQWSALVGSPLVVLSKDRACAVRSRFDAAHELGHLVLHRGVDRRRINSRADWKIIEDQAHRFAAAFLLPAKPFAEELWAPTLDGMLALKERRRVSVAMMIKRCEDLGITGPDQTRRLWINYNRRGWRGEEPLDAVLKAEQPRILRRSIEALIDERVCSRDQIIGDLCLPAREIEELCALPSGYLKGSQAEVKALPRLRGDVVRKEQGRPDATGEVISFASWRRFD
jgi:Zn-dependent peptidase ImmA (M78 family)/transcriptional regulator with XRE-family HTH domain